MAKYSKTDKSGESKDDLLHDIKGWYKLDNEKFKVWEKEASEDFRFRDGEQWNEEEKAALMEQRRPVLVFNRTGVMVDAVVGSEIGNRREVRFIPREQNDAKPNEILTSAAEWFRDLCDAEDEESEAFKDAVTGGMGWTETRLDFEDNPAGEPRIEHFDPMEARWDANAVKSNLVDSTRRWRVRKMPLDQAKAMFPDAEEEDLNAAWADTAEEETETKHIDRSNRYGGDGEEQYGEDDKVTIVGCQYYEKKPYYKALIVGPDGMPQEAELDAEKFEIASNAGAILKSVKLTRKVIVQCWIGRVVLKKPQPTQTGTWTWNCITGLKDKEKGIFYGIVRRAKDPQRWANKWLSQMMHILNSQAKGGIMAEEGVFANQRDAEVNWAKPEGITMLSRGAISGGKIQPKPVAQFPSGFDRLLQYADEAIVKATGINMELLGMREVNQPGVLEYQRKQSGIAILASLFDSLRRYRKIQGRGMLHLIQNFLSDGRLVRIVGEENAQYVPLTKDAVSSAEYDIIVDDSPTSTNEKEKTWQLLQGILPMFKDQLTPKHMLLLAEYSPLPSSLVDKLKGMAQEGEQSQQDPTQNPAFMLEQAKLQNDAKAIELEILQEQNKARELDFKIMEAQGKAQIAVMNDQTERQRISVDSMNAAAALTEAQKPQFPFSN